MPRPPPSLSSTPASPAPGQHRDLRRLRRTRSAHRARRQYRRPLPRPLRPRPRGPRRRPRRSRRPRRDRGCTMIGLGTYAFFWQHSDRADVPLSLIGAFEATRELGVDLFQICDYAPLEAMTDAELRDAATAARDLGLTIELGTKGIEPAHLGRFLALAGVFDAALVRGML